MFHVPKNIGRPEKDGLLLIALTRADWAFDRPKEDGLCLVALKRADLFEPKKLQEMLKMSSIHPDTGSHASQ